MAASRSCARPNDIGFPELRKRGLARARGECLVLLNNDTIVTDGWLNQLIGLATMSPAIGMVGPTSNYAAPPQLVENVPYRIGPRRGCAPDASAQERLVDVSAVERFACEYREEHKGKWVQAERLGGFCLLLKRDVFGKLALLLIRRLLTESDRE
jgi:GT2 family glycosyltransferase